MRELVPEWLRDYRREWLGLDVVAGLTAAAVVIPKALAYASIAGLPVEVGLYTCFVPMIVYALAGTSRPLSVSTTTTLAILTAAALDRVVPEGATALLGASATLAVLVGAILVAAGLLRLGFVANFISEPVLIGFKAGIGLVIVFDQVPKLLGIHIDKGPFFHNIAEIIRHLPDASVPTVAVGATVVAMLVVLEHLVPRAPVPLIAVAAAIVGTRLLGLEAHGVGTVGHVPTGLPALILPQVSLVETLWPPAMGIALMSFAETIAAGRAFARSGEPTPQANRELVATGLANAGGALFGAMPVGGGTTQTAVNRLAGARSQVAELVTAAATLGTMLFLAPLIALMPQATLAAIVIVYSIGLIKPAEFRNIRAVREMEFVWALAAVAGVVLLGTLQGILVAIVMSLVGLAYQTADPPVYVLARKPGTNVFRPRTAEHPEDESFPGLLLLRPEGRMFFANADHVAAKIRPLVVDANPTVVALDLSGVFDLEYTALRMLADAEERQRAVGVVTWLVGLNPAVLAMVQRSPLGQTLGRERMFFNLEQAVARYQAAHATKGSG